MINLSAGSMGCVLLLFCAATVTSSPAQTFTTLYSFCFQINCTDGAEPYASLVQGFDGNFYGTTYTDGAYLSGTIFKITPTGALTTLYSFCSQTNCVDGEHPGAQLVQATDRNFYGTTEEGGAYGYGTVFKITAAGALTTLYSFCSQTSCTDGRQPQAGLIQGTDGNFYGTMYFGGGYSPECGSLGCGTVFKITPSGTLTTLHIFCSQTNCTDGGVPQAGLVQATDGNFYGTASSFGGSSGITDSGTVFKLTSAGTLTTLYSFCSQTSCADGAYPQAELVQATDGNFYGTTSEGGTPSGYCPYPYGCGTVFKLTPTGALTNLYSFCPQPNCFDGWQPEAGLVQATDGNFYGTTYSGGANSLMGCGGGSCGTVFKITTAGAQTTLYSFCSQPNCIDGEEPNAALFQATSGNFYGTTYGGGTKGNFGTVFILATGLGPFVIPEPDSGQVNSTVGILGQGFTGTTRVTFNGVAARFNVVSDTFITASVPRCASTGPVIVLTPNGPLTSNLPFRIVESTIVCHLAR